LIKWCFIIFIFFCTPKRAQKSEIERSLDSSEEALLEKSHRLPKKGNDIDQKFQTFFKTNFPWHAIYVAENVDKALEEVRLRTWLNIFGNFYKVLHFELVVSCVGLSKLHSQLVQVTQPHILLIFFQLLPQNFFTKTF